jgi:hypothetical protein
VRRNGAEATILGIDYSRHHSKGSVRRTQVKQTGQARTVEELSKPRDLQEQLQGQKWIDRAVENVLVKGGISLSGISIAIGRSSMNPTSF